MNKTEKDKLKCFFNCIIEREFEKSIENQDSDLIDDCVDFIIQIDGMSDNVKLSKSDIENAKNKIYSRMKTKPENSRKNPIKLRRTLIFACIILISLLAISGVTIAFDIDWQEPLIKFFDTIKVDTSMDVNDTEFDKANDILTLKSIEKFLEYFDNGILYPTYLPDGVEFEKAIQFSDETISVLFNHQKIDFGYLIYNNTTEGSDKYDVIIGEYQCTVKKSDMNYYVDFFINDKMYTFFSSNYDELIQIIESLK